MIKVPTRDFKSIPVGKFYIFDIYAKEGRINHPAKLLASNNISFLLDDNSINFWDDLLNVYGPFDTRKEVVDYWKNLYKEDYV